MSLLAAGIGEFFGLLKCSASSLRGDRIRVSVISLNCALTLGVSYCTYIAPQ